MTGASAHNKEMKDFVGAEAFVTAVKKRQFQRIDDTADRINNASGKQP